MTDPITTRPRILLDAARTVARHLPGDGDVTRLETMEHDFERARRGRISGYSARRHVTMLAELLAARLRNCPV